MTPQTLPSPPSPAPTAPEVALPWLMHLRWVAALGQTVTLVLVGLLLRIDLPWAPLLSLIGVTVVSNTVLALWRRPAQEVARLLLPGLLLLDTLLFTGLLYFAGGPENPFSVLYVVHVAMATVTLGARWTWGMVAVSVTCFALLFWAHVPLPLDRTAGGLPLHRAGLWLGLTLVTVVIAYFVGRVMLALRAREQQLDRARALAARNERLASLTTLATGAAHELGTPLGTIAVVARELERAAERLGEEALEEDARLIRDQVDRCRRILDRMSARAEEPLARAPEALAPDALAKALRARLGAEGERLDLVVGPGAAGELIVARPDLEEALLPLLVNALQAAPADERVQLEITRAQGLVRFAVRDPGAGMDAAALARAGEPFFSTKPLGEGTGLGLHLVRLLAERLGGRLALSSTPGVGTQATLELPDPQPEQLEAVS